jgi:hypothetical protein
VLGCPHQTTGRGWSKKGLGSGPALPLLWQHPSSKKHGDAWVAEQFWPSHDPHDRLTIVWHGYQCQGVHGKQRQGVDRRRVWTVARHCPKCFKFAPHQKVYQYLTRQANQIQPRHTSQGNSLSPVLVSGCGHLATGRCQMKEHHGDAPAFSPPVRFFEPKPYVEPGTVST